MRHLDGPPDWLLLGTNHRHATVEQRGRLAIGAGALPVWLDELRRRAGNRSAIDGVFVLSTCNRLELYVDTRDPAAAEREIRLAMAGHAGADLLTPGETSYRLVGDAAVEHLYRVACGLDSLLVGEAEILGQLRDAAAMARSAGALGPRLDALVTSAVHVGRRARLQTRIGVGATSASGAAVVLAEQALGSLKGVSALVIGAGHAGRLALSRLAKRRPARLWLANRTRETAEAPARRARAEVCALDDVPGLLASMDVVIAALTLESGQPLVTPEVAAAAIGTRPSRPLLFVDLSVPAAVAADVGGVSGVRRFDLDSLRHVQTASAASRQREIPRVEALIQQALAGVREASAGNFAADLSV